MAKLKYDEVRKEIESEDWKMVSEEYENLKTDLDLLCPNGHLNVYTLEQWRRKRKCPICENNEYANQSNKVSKKKGYRIMAFDQASITSGWSVFDNEELIRYGKWTSKGTSSTERISLTKGWVASLIARWKPDEIILEDIQLQKFGNGDEAVVVYKKLAHLQGVLKNYFFEMKIPYRIVSPATWRSHSEIKGRSRTDKKKSAQMLIKKLYDVNVTQDEADAILIGAWAAFSHKQHEVIVF